MTKRANDRDSRRAWRRLLENPDYVADWRANAGPMVREALPYVFRRQTAADLKAGRWDLLVWEDPRHPQWAEFFRAGAPAVKARVADAGVSEEHAWRRLLGRADARFSGLRLLDGALVLQVSRNRKTVQIRVVDGEAFDPAHSGLEVAMRKVGRTHGGWARLESLDAIVFGSQAAPSSRRAPPAQRS